MSYRSATIPTRAHPRRTNVLPCRRPRPRHPPPHLPSTSASAALTTPPPSCARGRRPPYRRRAPARPYDDTVRPQAESSIGHLWSSTVDACATPLPTLRGTLPTCPVPPICTPPSLARRPISDPYSACLVVAVPCALWMVPPSCPLAVSTTSLIYPPTLVYSANGVQRLAPATYFSDKCFTCESIKGCPRPPNGEPVSRAPGVLGQDGPVQGNAPVPPRCPSARCRVTHLTG